MTDIRYITCLSRTHTHTDELGSFTLSWDQTFAFATSFVLLTAFEIEFQEIDISLNGFMRSTTRDQAARFIIKFGPLDLSIAYTMPPSVIPPTTYLLPFHFTVWILCFSALVCSLAMLAVVMLYSPIWQSSGDPTIENHTNYFRLLSGVFFELGNPTMNLYHHKSRNRLWKLSIFAISALEDPPGLPARIVHGTLLVATMAIFIFYTSVFTSFLAHRDLKLPIETLDDLIDNTDYRAVTVRSTVYYGMFKVCRTSIGSYKLMFALEVHWLNILYWFQNSKAGVFYKLWNTKFQNSDKSSVQETVFDGILQMYYGMYVLALDSATIVANMNNNCSILLLRTPYLRENMQLVVRNDFPYNRILHDK